MENRNWEELGQEVRGRGRGEEIAKTHVHKSNVAPRRIAGHYGFSRRRGSALGDNCGEAGVEAFSVAYGEFVGAVIGSEDEDVASGIENGRAHFAAFEMLLDGGEQIGIELMIQILGDVFPDVFALQLHWNHLRKKPGRATLP